LSSYIQNEPACIESSRHGERNGVNEKNTGRTSRYGGEDVAKGGRTDWARLRAMTEEEIDAAALADEDNPPLTEEELSGGEIVCPADRRGKVPISIRMDERALERFKRKGPRYQTRLNDLMVADSENRILVLDQSVTDAYETVKNPAAVMNAILRSRVPSAGASPEWKTGPVVETRVTHGGRGGWVKDGEALRISVDHSQSVRHA
jgi:uncharacterized protein (DUF4415 family)